MSPFTNYFTEADVARRYARSRPNAHRQVMELIREPLQLGANVSLAADIACGTGMSTVALRTLAEQVIGVDPSREMLAQAPAAPGIMWSCAAAEQLPLADASVDLMTVCNGFHWFQRAEFLREARRTLKPRCPLVVYEVSFLIRIAEPVRGDVIPEFPSWFRQWYLQRYPAPPRGAVQFAKDSTEEGFRLLTHFDWNTWVPFSHAQFVDYLSTQSNVVDAVRKGADVSEIQQELLRQTEPYFAQDAEGSRSARVAFGGGVWLLQGR